MENIHENLINRSLAQAQPNFFFIAPWKSPLSGSCLDTLKGETERGRPESQAVSKLREESWEMDQIGGVIGIMFCSFQKKTNQLVIDSKPADWISAWLSALTYSSRRTGPATFSNSGSFSCCRTSGADPIKDAWWPVSWAQRSPRFTMPSSNIHDSYCAQYLAHGVNGAFATRV